MILTLYDCLNASCCFSVPFYGPCAVDITDRRGPSNKMHRQLQLKKNKVIVIVIVMFQQGVHSVTLIFSGALQHTHVQKT